MAKIAYITKYPPLEGGMAAKAYWLARALGERGHEVHVITDAINVDDLYHIKSSPETAGHPKVKVHRAVFEIPWIIPQERHTALSLLNKALEVVENEKIDVIFAAYLVPYGLVGCLVSSQTHAPLVLQHGGSDINKFVASGVWGGLWKSYLRQARLIITDADHSMHFSSLSLPTMMAPPYVPDPTAFFPVPRRSNKRLRLALIGKANYHWQHKGWQRVIEIWAGLVNHCDFIVVSQGVGLNSFRKFVHQRMGDCVEWRSFVHPSAMPDILRHIDYLFFFEKDMPFLVFSNLPLEAVRCGAKILTDTIDFASRHTVCHIASGGITDTMMSSSHVELNIRCKHHEVYAFDSHNGALNFAACHEEYISILEHAFI